MYTIQTKENIKKKICDLSPEEIKDAIYFNNIKKRQKRETLLEKRLQLLDIESTIDSLQISADKMRREIESECNKQITIDKILTELDKAKVSPQTKFLEAWIPA